MRVYMVSMWTLLYCAMKPFSTLSFVLKLWFSRPRVVFKESLEMWEFILIAKKCLWSQISPLQVTVRTGMWKGRSLVNVSQFFKSEQSFFFFNEVLRTSEARNLLWEVFLYCPVSEKETRILSALMCYFSVKACRNIFLILRCFQIVYTEGK